MLRNQSHFLKKQFVHSFGGREGSINYDGRGGDQRKSLNKNTLLQGCRARGLRSFSGSEERVFLCLLQKILFFPVRFGGLPPYALGKAHALAGLKWTFDLYVRSPGWEKTWPQTGYTLISLVIHLSYVDRQCFNRKEGFVCLFVCFFPRETSSEVVVFGGVVSLPPVQPPEREKKAFSVESTFICLQTLNKRIIHFLFIIKFKIKLLVTHVFISRYMFFSLINHKH